MTKVLSGIIVALSLLIVFGFWRYSAIVGELGEYKQASQQYQQKIKDQETQIEQLGKNRQAEDVISRKHFDEAMAIKDQQMQETLALKQHEFERLKNKHDQLITENSRLKELVAHAKNNAANKEIVCAEIEPSVKEENNESLSEKCVDVRIPEFYLKQL